MQAANLIMSSGLECYANLTKLYTEIYIPTSQMSYGAAHVQHMHTLHQS